MKIELTFFKFKNIRNNLANFDCDFESYHKYFLSIRITEFGEFFAKIVLKNNKILEKTGKIRSK